MSTDKVIVEFVKPKNHPFPLVSWIIRLIENTEFSHVVIRIDAGVNREFVYHSHFNGVNFLSKKLYNKKYKTTSKYEFFITKEQRKKLITYFLDNAGESYPMKELVGVLFVRIAGRFGFKINNPLGSNGMYCSELAVKVLNILGFKKTSGKYKVTALKEIQDILNDN